MLIVWRTSIGPGKDGIDERYYRVEAIEDVGIILQQTLHLLQGPTLEVKCRKVDIQGFQGAKKTVKNSFTNIFQTS